jgi:peptide-methionine (R)-S-oxide reductase
MIGDARMSRRTLLAGAFVGVAGLLAWRWMGDERVNAATAFEIEKSDEEWRRILTPAQYDILRRHGTERAGTSPLNGEKRAGKYLCAGCDLPLFASETKYESGTGWPSFYEPLPAAVGTSIDYMFLMRRVEVHCRRCGGHLGHVFDDGPPPTGKRYCMNGVALKFEPADKAA